MRTESLFHADAAESYVGELREQWTTPLDRECLTCYQSDRK
jgi:hypothetical protein